MLSEHHILSPKDLQVEYLSASAPGAEDQVLTLVELERRHIERVLRTEHGQVKQAAKKLRLSRSALYEKIKKHGIGLS